MQVSVRLLKEYIDIPLSIEELVNGLTMVGLEVEEVFDLGLINKEFVIGQIENIESHPNADKLSLCQVSTGENTRSIICGADNMKTGDKVVVALPNTTLPNGMKLKKAKIRGVVSEGMMCSTEELGLPKAEDGIMILPSDSPLGEGFDLLLDISITPNRPDCLSLLGIAREIQALTDSSVKPPKPRITEKLDLSSSLIDINIDDKNGCPRYCARVLDKIEIQPSPLWLQNALLTAGMRPINNIVDVTNFVLLELGHPLHAFDYDLIKGKKIIVRTARDGEKIIAIDEQEYTLEEDDLVIADQDRPIALAGIIGGKNTEVHEDTTMVVLEAAYFNPRYIRRTARKTGIQTGASYHFERGMDPEILPLALNRAAELIQKISSAEVKKEVIDVTTNSIPKIPTINLRIPRVNEILGTSIPLNQINNVFQKLDIEVVDSSEEALIVRPPSYRVDIQREIDCIEEIARIYGYDEIPETYPYMNHIERAPVISEHDFLQEFRETLSRNGLQEVIQYSFLSKSFQEQLGFSSEKFISIANPLSQDHSTMRISLLPGLLKNYMNNQSLGYEGTGCFEVGKIFYRDFHSKECEDWSIAFIIGGEKLFKWYDQQSWDFYDLKGIVESVLNQMGIEDFYVQRLSDSSLYHPGKSLVFKQGETILFEGGELHPSLLQLLNLKTSVYCGRFHPDAIKQLRDTGYESIQLYRYPGNQRDISMIFDNSIPYAKIEEAIQEAGDGLLWKVILVDHYQSPKLGKDKKSLTFHLIYRHPEKTLSDEEITPSFENIIKRLEEQFQARLR